MIHYIGVQLAKFEFVDWLLNYLVFEFNQSFDWDEGNTHKSLDKHGISCNQVEYAFADTNLLALGIQVEPFTNENRFGILAKDSLGNILFICFTFRNNRIRTISCRIANHRERNIYGQEIC